MKTAIQIGRVMLLLSAAMLAITTAAGCADASAKSSYETPAVIKPQEITINSKNYFFVAPDTIEAGLSTIHLRNAGPALQHAQIVRLPQGQTLDGLLNEIRQKGEAAFAQVGLFGGPNAPTPGGEATITVDLQPGSYALICFIPTAEGVPHMMKGMTRAITVIPAKRVPATAPVADVSLSLSDYKFDFSSELKAGERTIKVENKATQPHEMFLAKLTMVRRQSSS